MLARAGASAAALRSAAPRLAARVPRRQMSGHGSPQEIFEHKELWFKTSVTVTAVAVVPFLLFILYKEATHEHFHKVDYAHMHQRHKAFPWASSDCALFDLECRREAKHGGAAHAAHH